MLADLLAIGLVAVRCDGSQTPGGALPEPPAPMTFSAVDINRKYQVLDQAAIVAENRASGADAISHRLLKARGGSEPGTGSSRLQKALNNSIRAHEAVEQALQREIGYLVLVSAKLSAAERKTSLDQQNFLNGAVINNGRQTSMWREAMHRVRFAVGSGDG